MGSDSMNRIMAVLAAVVCVVSVTCTFVIASFGSDDRSGSIDSVIFDMYEEEGIVHFYFYEDYLFDRYLDESSTSLHELGEFLADNVTVGRVPVLTDIVCCSAYTVQKDTEDGYYAGRNFDYRYSEPAIVHTSPDGGYESVSIVDMVMFDDTSETMTEREQDTVFNALPYLPLDGVNEKGVFVCVNVVHNADPFLQDDPGKSTIFITSAIRLILDNAATTQEAVDLIMDYNLHSNVNYHLLVCDSSGDSRAIEVVDNRTYSTSTDVMTNHYITDEGADVEVSESSGDRYAILRGALDADDTMSEDEVKSVLISVQQSDSDRIHYTRWSVIYDLETLDCVVWMVTPFDEDAELDYDTPYRFSVFS